MPDNFNINQLQAYIQSKKEEYITLTKPGYEVFFYSRFNRTASIIEYVANNRQQTGYNDIKTFESKDIKANAYLTSNVDRNSDVASVLSVTVHNSVISSDGSTCTLEIVNPDGIEYFLPTIGSYGKNAKGKHTTDSTTDYDFSEQLDTDKQRIGGMDTVLIRLKNTKTSRAQDPKEESETVFRGVVRSIHRSSSPTGGSKLVIRLADFSEYLRMATALPLGIFSTISFSITGRGLVDNLLKYTNRLYTGDWRFLGQDIAAQFESAAQNFLTGVPGLPENANSDALAAQSAQNHSMAVPPFLFLEGSDLNKDVSAENLANGNIQAPASNTNNNSNDTTQNPPSSGDDQTGIVGSVISAINTNVSNFLASNTFKQTPEDQETIRYYQVALQKNADNNTLNRYSKAQDAGLNRIEGGEKYAWILSDLYLDKGLITFEHQKVWSTMENAARRSMREVYFDFAPKLTKTRKGGPKNPYDTALVSEVKSDPELPDLHPNLGILKYRLSPCLRAYQEGQDQTEIFQWSVSDDEVLNYDTSESEQEVYTAVFGFGTALDPVSQAQTLKEVVAGQSKGVLAFAHSIDPQIERRLGYRFMSEHDMKIKIPILMYLTSYVLLMQSEMNMFTAHATLLGNPKYKPGSIIRLEGRNADYYCTDVLHKWSISEGYTTELILSYGHTSGILPAALTGGYAQDNVALSQVCLTRSAALEPYISKKTIIGGVNAHCLVSAMWEFMTCGASTDEAMKQATPEYEKSKPKTATYSEWILPYNWNDLTLDKRHNTDSHSIVQGYSPININKYDSQINAALIASGLNKYNVTVNAIKNLIALESGGWFQDAFNAKSFNDGDGGTGWFQLTAYPHGHDIPAFKRQFSIDILTATTNFTAALESALRVVLLPSFQNAFKNSLPSNSTGKAYLGGFVGYNAGPQYGNASDWNKFAPGTSTPYVYLVFGEQQANAIANNSRLPSGAKLTSILSGLTCQKPASDLQQWPYSVYGPIGMRLDAYKARHGNATDADTKKVLTIFSSGMKEAASYITSLLNKYNGKDKILPGAGAKMTEAYQVNGDDLMEKVIAAWFSNENLESLRPGEGSKLKMALDAITKLYGDCQNCNALNKAAVQEDLTKSLAAEQISWRIPVDNPILTSGKKFRFSPTAGKSRPHDGCDWQNTAFYNAPVPVFAAADGYVLATYPDSGGDGAICVILHSKPEHGIISRYIDLAQASYLIKPGQNVKKGQQIATTAIAGKHAGKNNEAFNADGAHCHHEIRTGAKIQVNGNKYSIIDVGTAVDPLIYLGKLPHVTAPGALTPS